jgi:kynurenine formamidase
MRIRSFIIAYALVLAILLFAERRPDAARHERYSHIIDLTDAQNSNGPRTVPASDAGTRIVSPAALIPGTWATGQIPADRLVAPLVVMDLKPSPEGASAISLDDVADWESSHGAIPQGAVVAIRRTGASSQFSNALPITADAAQFLMDARYTLGFALETSADLTADRALARQLALHGNYVVEGTARLATLPQTGSLVIVAPAKNKNAAEAPVRVLAMVR